MIMAGSALFGCESETPATGGPATGVGGSTSTPSGASGVHAPNAGTATPSGGSTAKPPAGPGTGGTTAAAGGSVGASTGTGGTKAPAAGAVAAAGGATAAAGGATATAGGAAGPTAGAGTGTPVAAGSCGPEATIAAANLGDPKMLGPWKTAMKASTGPSGSSTLFYPMELGKDGVTHPVFHWGCGASSEPAQYADHLTLLASYGIVVIANASGSMPGKASVDWILAENEKADSMFYKKLDPNRVSTGGHSLGALETFEFAKDPRLMTYVLVCGGSTSGTTGAADIHGPAIFLGGEGESGTTNFANDYKAITKAPSVFVTKTDTDHIYCARNNLGPWVAFLRWNLCGEEKWKAEFQPDGTYCKAPWLACQTKGL
jgi:hypothetical protein